LLDFAPAGPVIPPFEIYRHLQRFGIEEHAQIRELLLLRGRSETVDGTATESVCR
jgi:hypothetical protein